MDNNGFNGVIEDIFDPDQMACQKSADLDLQCFQNMIYVGLVWQRVNIYNIVLIKLMSMASCMISMNWIPGLKCYQINKQTSLKQEFVPKLRM